MTYDVEFITNLFHSDWSHLHDSIVGKPVTSGGDRCPFLPQAKRDDFGRITPDDRLEARLDHQDTSDRA